MPPYTFFVFFFLPSLFREAFDEEKRQWIAVSIQPTSSQVPPSKPSFNFSLSLSKYNTVPFFFLYCIIFVNLDYVAFSCTLLRWNYRGLIGISRVFTTHSLFYFAFFHPTRCLWKCCCEEETWTPYLCMFNQPKLFFCSFEGVWSWDKNERNRESRIRNHQNPRRFPQIHSWEAGCRQAQFWCWLQRFLSLFTTFVWKLFKMFVN